MTSNELQDAIFQHRLAQGDVSLASIPTLKQLDWLLFIDSEKNYLNYTAEDALNDIILYFAYQNKRRKRRQNGYY